MPINRTGAKPLKAQILDELRQRLASGEYPVGSKFPSLRALAVEFGVAELTAQGAVQELQREGVLEAAAGKGNFVMMLPTKESSADAPEGPACAELEKLRAEVAELRERLEVLEAASR
ncbi:GntR family transcriptional regulator [Kitasatospora xanthocidica]|uniref:GntR family transcriptional regulator n=1 Tax=Kitasatospora xanthocidica TaxID=83382 RepID=A0A372ZXD4_9ACTN|nr:GntR family transcriptional regulator [Kitasatospora xanthocidica]RGD60431.1 GntR family transcriptional regulator [Kitasatospora xanthocidica]